MPLTNAEKQSRARQRRAEKMARMEAAIFAVVDAYDDASNYDMLTAQLEAAVQQARQALNPGKEMGE